MNYFLYGREKINTKKVIFSILIIISILIVILLIKSFLKNKNDNIDDKIEKKSTSTVFYSNDKSISLELENNLNLENEISDYLLELHSEKNLSIFLSKKDVLENKNLIDVVNADKELFIGDFSNTANISEIKEIYVGDYPTCLYSFQYLDKKINTAFNFNVAWIQIDNFYYIFDIEYPTDDSGLYPNIVSNVLTSLKLNSNTI